MPMAPCCCVRLRVPVVVVSARQDEAGKVALLDAGADDYVVKPFSVPELLARVRVALRHRGVSVAPAQTCYAVDGLEIDLDSHRVTLHGAALHLTPTEYRLLARLVRTAGRVVTHRQLLVDVWGAEFTEHTHYLRIYMGTLRGKIEADPAAPRFLLTGARRGLSPGRRIGAATSRASSYVVHAVGRAVGLGIDCRPH